MRNNLPAKFCGIIACSYRHEASKESAAREKYPVVDLLFRLYLVQFDERQTKTRTEFISASRLAPGWEMGQFFAYRNDIAIYRWYLVQFCASISLLRKSERPIVNEISFTSKIHSAAASNTLLSAWTAETIRELIQTQHTGKSYRECVYGEKSLMISSRDNRTGKRDDQTTVYTPDAFVISFRITQIHQSDYSR